MAEFARCQFEMDDAKKQKAKYWTHNLYRGPEGQPVLIEYCRTRTRSEEVAKTFLNEPLIGFDMEWYSGKSSSRRKAGQDNQPSINKAIERGQHLKRSISLIQIASEDRIALFHVALHAGNTVADLIPPSLRKLIESDKISKTGVAVHKADGARLKRFFGLRPRGLAELSHLHNLVTYAATQPERVNKKLVALKKLTEEHLGLPLFKGPVRTSDWTRALSAAQVEYAAADAYAGYMIYRALDKKRRSMQPVPPVPPFSELFKPILLAEGVPAPNGNKTPMLEARNGKRFPPRQTEPSTAAEGHDVQQNQPALDHIGKAIYDTLTAHRADVAAHNRCWPHSIASDDVLLRIAHLRPADVTQLRHICNVDEDKAAQHGQQWLEIVQRCVAAALPTPAVSFSGQPMCQSDRAGPVRKPAADVVTRPAPHAVTRPAPDPAVSARVLFGALRGLRNQWSIQSGLTQDAMAADDVLWRLAEDSPQSASMLRSVSGTEELVRWAEKKGFNLLGFMQKYRPVCVQARAPLAEILQVSAVQPNGPPRPKLQAGEVEVIDLTND